MHAFSRREGMAVDSLSFLPSLSPHLRSPFRVAEVKEESLEPRTAREQQNNTMATAEVGRTDDEARTSGGARRETDRRGMNGVPTNHPSVQRRTSLRPTGNAEAAGASICRG